MLNTIAFAAILPLRLLLLLLSMILSRRSCAARRLVEASNDAAILRIHASPIVLVSCRMEP